VSAGRPDRQAALKLDHVRLLVDDFRDALRSTSVRDPLGKLIELYALLETSE